MFTILQSNHKSLELGFLIIRIGIGAVFATFGFMKLTEGPQKWLWLGSQLVSIGITFWPTFWGFLAANAEFLGGLCLVFGCATRLGAGLIAVVMSMALVYHFKNGDAWGVYSFALSLLIVVVGIFFAGAGHYSLDHYFHERVSDRMS